MRLVSHITQTTRGVSMPKTNYAKVYPKTLSEHGATTMIHQLHTLFGGPPTQRLLATENLSVFTATNRRNLMDVQVLYGHTTRVGKYNHALNTDYPTTYTIITPDFRTQGVYNLTGTEQSATWFVFNDFQVPWKELREAALADTGQTPASTGIRAVTQLFNFRFQRIERDALWGYSLSNGCAPPERNGWGHRDTFSNRR